MLKPIALAALAVLILAAGARADDASKAAKVEEFFRLAKMDQMLEQSLNLTMNQVKSEAFRQTIGVKVPPEQTKIFENFQDQVTKLISSVMSWNALKPEFIKLYSDAYTEAELDDILAFYKSPTGMSMVAKTPALMAKASLTTQKQMAVLAPELQKLMKEFVAQVEASKK